MTQTTEFKFISAAGIIVGFSLLITYAEVSPQAASGEIPGKYIVVLKDSAADADLEIADIERKHGVSAEMRYSRALKGFSANLSGINLTKMKMDPRVAFVSEDRIVTMDVKPTNAGIGSQPALPPQASQQAQSIHTPEPGQTTPVNPPANEDQAGGIKGKPNKGETVQPVQPAQVVPINIKRVRADNLTNKGLGIGVAVLDTGIDLKHPDLVGNIAEVSKSCVSGTVSAQDDNGHGTHVAGTIAAANNTIGVVGVAPEAKLYAVKVLDKTGSGTWSSIICGIDWVTANAQALNIKVANMSLGGTGTSDNNCGLSNGDALHRAICNSTAQGVTYVVSAGNNATSSLRAVPAGYDDTVITVSALADADGQFGGFGSSTPYGADDTFASFSNYGSAVDIGAPGVQILSTWIGGAYKTISGTSMSAPHIAGAAALYVKSNPTANWMQVRNALLYFGERSGAGHTDPSGLHPEPVVNAILP